MDERSSLGIGYYLAVLRRHWKTVVAGALIGLLLAAAYLVFGGAKVTATTLVNVNVIVADPFNPSRPASGLLDAATEGELASSYVVASEAAKVLPEGDSTEELRQNVDVQTGTDATTAAVSYSSSTVSRAVAGADAIANSYLAYRQSQADARRTTMRNQLEEQLAALNQSLAADAADRFTLTSRIANIEFQINQLNAIDTTGGAVITPAAQNPVKTNYPIVLASGLLVGLVAGVLLAFASNAVKRRVHDSHDVERVGAGPVLARLISPESTLPARGEELDSYRAVREQLFAGAQTPIAALAVVDESNGRASSGVAPNLALVLAQAGFDVELVMMGAAPGYQSLLAESLQLRLVSEDAGTPVFGSAVAPRLTVVQPGRGELDSGADDYVTEAVRRRLVTRKDSTVVILALPARAPRASKMAAGRLAGAAVLTVEAGQSRAADLEASAQELQGVHARVLGTILVKSGRRLARRPHGADNVTRRRPERETVAS